MRSEDSIKNSLVNTFGQLLTILFQFILRMVFIRKLGDTYLSINSLFTNILSMLSIAELGLEFAICYSMYKPLAEKDLNKTNMLLHWFKKVYKIIGTIIFVAGLALMPFLHLLMDETAMIDEIYLIFLLYILKTCVSYWLYSYRLTIIQADQKRYKLQKYSYLISICNSLVQLLILLLFQSFIAYLSCALIFTIIDSLFIGIYVGKKYPFIKNKPEGTLSKEEKKSLFRNVYGASLYKICNIIYKSSDTIIIAAASTISFAVVGYYSNYMLIFNSLTGIISKLLNSTSASIGNFNVTESPEHKKSLFDSLSFVNFWIYGVVAICCLCLIDPFISIFFNARCVLDFKVVLLMLTNFLLMGLFETILTFKDSCGLFYKGRFRPLISVILNIVFSVILMQFMGLTGILLGTLLSFLLSTFIYDPQLIYKNVFKRNVLSYYAKLLLQVGFIGIVGALCYLLISQFAITNVFTWILGGILIFIISNLCFWICFRWTKEFKYLKTKIISFLKELRKRNA